MNSNSTAFPRFSFADGEGLSTPGLTKREFFAAMAMQGLLAQESGDWCRSEVETAKMAVSQADSLMEALESEEEAA